MWPGSPTSSRPSCWASRCRATRLLVALSEPVTSPHPRFLHDGGAGARQRDARGPCGVHRPRADRCPGREGCWATDARTSTCCLNRADPGARDLPRHAVQLALLAHMVWDPGGDDDLDALAKGDVMLSDADVAATVAVNDLKTAARFYEQVVGLTKVGSGGDTVASYRA